MKQPRQYIIIEEKNDVSIVTFCDRKVLDEHDIQIWGYQLTLLPENGQINVILDFKIVEYMSSAALGKLITLSKGCYGKQGKVVICNMDRQIYDTFEITGLKRIFHWADTLEDAIKMF